MSDGQRKHATVTVLFGEVSCRILLKRTEHYHYLANEFRRLAADDSSIEIGNYYLQMARH
jgi:hypothetical protein